MAFPPCRVEQNRGKLAGMVTSSDWPPAPDAVVLHPDEVHVWRMALSVPEPRIRRLRELLTPDERTRAERFRFAPDRDSFIVARGTLRTLLGRYLRREPSALRFSYGPQGKPALVEPSDGLSFNVSHSHGFALYAVTRDRLVGVDIERIRPDLADEKIAERFFAPGEVARLFSLAPELRHDAFFACWTRKEAYIKAVGQGLSLSLQQFEVSLAPYEPAALLATFDDPGEASYWTLHNLEPGAGYAAAVAVRGLGVRIACFQS
jgi:4'-phosphopantetheinyl transferase